MKKIYSPCSQTNIEGGFVARYIQAKRHWWASLDVGYCVRRSIFPYGYDAPNNSAAKIKVDLSQRFSLVGIFKLWCVWFSVFEEHFFLAQAIIMIASSSVIIPPGLIPVVSNGYWNYFSADHLVPQELLTTNQVGNYIRIAAAIMYVISVVLYEYYQRYNGVDRWINSKGGKRGQLQVNRKWYDVLDWLSFPLFSIFYVILPQMHAQILQLYSENLVYVVALKPTTNEDSIEVIVIDAILDAKSEKSLNREPEKAASKDTLHNRM